MPCTKNTIDSNVTGLAFAEEECLKQLPGTGGEDAVWYGMEPNSYSDLGGELTTVARTPISQSRQNKKGTVTDLSADGGFNIDFTQNNLTRLLQGFFFADAREKATTAPLNGSPIVITAVDGVNEQYEAASGLDIFKVGHIILASGFGIAGNNGIKVIDTVAAGAVDTVENLTAEASPPADANIRAVGFQFQTAEAAIVVSSGIVSLTASTTNLTTLGLLPGEWVFLGGDGGKAFANNKGYARIKSIASGAIVFDDVSWTPASEAGTGLTIQMFFGTVLKNESAANLIKRRSYNIERTLGEGATATQAEYLEGALANELTLNIPVADKLNADLSFVACDNTYRSGESGDELKDGTRIAALGEDAFNTSSDIYRIKMHLHDDATSTPGSLFAFITEGNISINNNVSPVKAVGVLGAVDVSVGNFVVGGSLTALFSTTAACKAVRDNADVGVSTILAKKNAGFVFDIPLLALGGGRVNVEKDQPITVPLEPAGAENALGYTMMYVNYPYLPTLAMPQ